MSCRYLLDTHIFIYLRSKRAPYVRSRFAQLEPGEAALSVITYGELLFGAEKSRDRNVAMRGLKELTRVIPVLSLPDAAAEAYGAMRTKLETSGRSIGNNDLWIAAHAVAAGLVLVSNNEREFSRVGNLKLENWARG